MTSITLPRATAQQALEALEGSAGILQHEHVWPGAEKKSRFVIAALRTALAQQDEPLTIERLRDALVASRIIDPAAVEDPDEYDDGVTLHRIEALHRRIA